ncbi:hypothetical protein BPOR_0002g00250 [Botrytis porri]|uniref:Uncharacterized protein n=1 Tax=Botrytis porri TaxID=87229 RepID=A0A4Z1L6X0_9HELO|nr:hypothetical protein BPOR_0002g00250 [Botrytis porri]
MPATATATAAATAAATLSSEEEIHYPPSTIYYLLLSGTQPAIQDVLFINADAVTSVITRLFPRVQTSFKVNISSTPSKFMQCPIKLSDDATSGLSICHERTFHFSELQRCVAVREILEKDLKYSIINTHIHTHTHTHQCALFSEMSYINHAVIPALR